MKLLQIETDNKEVLADIRELAQKHKLKVQEWDVSNPKNPSPSNDPYFDNPKNIAEIRQGLKEIKEGKVVKMTDEQIHELFGL